MKRFYKWILDRWVAPRVPALVAFYLEFVGRTSRLDWKNARVPRAYERRGRNFLYAFWHGRQAFFVWSHRCRGFAVLVSQSKDGELIANVVHRFGIQTVRGSSSRGGARALAQLKRLLETGGVVGVTPDGPKGPRGSIHPGVLFLARKTGRPIVPIANSARRRLVFRGWDDYWVPVPFNRFLITHGRPVTVAPEDDLAGKAEELLQELQKTTEEADLGCLQPGSRAESAFFAAYALLSVPCLPFILFALFLRYPRSFFSQLRRGLGMRLGRIPAAARGLRCPVWIHAASLGECRAAFPLVRAIRKEFPGQSILFSCTSRAGIEEAERLGLGDAVTYAPIDHPWAVEDFFASARPSLVLLLESEIWPNWIRAAKSWDVPIGIVNGRISEQSARRYSRFRALCSIWMGRMDFVCAREERDAERYRRVGAASGRVSVCGNLKFDLFPWEANGRAEARPASADAGPIWAAGSLREGEEEIVAQAYVELLKSHPGLKLVLAPRHLERLEALQSLLKAKGLTFSSRTRAGLRRPDLQVLIWDSFGDLWEAYRECSLAFVGGSLVRKGGQNPIEPAHFSKPVLFGPSMENFEEPAGLLLKSGGAFQVRDGRELGAQVDALLRDPARLAACGEKAKAAVAALAGRATEKTMAVLRPYLDD